MKRIYSPQDQVFWYLNRPAVKPCGQNLTTDVVIIGGGMAGLAAAQAWNARGQKVVLLEKYYCGSGATGKSSGFITPHSELSLTEFAHQYGDQVAGQIWQLLTSGVHDIRQNILQHQFDCDYTPQETLIVATSPKGLKNLTLESQNLAKFGCPSTVHDTQSIQKQISSKLYFGGLAYPDTFRINAYAYCQELKQLLQSQGVLIFEETPVIEIGKDCVTTAQAKISAKQIIVCTDRFTPELGFLKQEIYHAQTFLMCSQVLTEQQISAIFPNQRHLTWDTDLIYNYFCITGQNRLLLGGGSMLNTYNQYPTHDSGYMLNKLTNYFHNHFPDAKVQFEQMWPGLIGLSKDIVPIAGRDQNNPQIYYIAAAAGLSIAAALGRYSAEHLIDGRSDLDKFFSPYRKFPISGLAQTLLGTKLSFALSNLIKMNVP
jgi:gamma-glutamylputrescine oxidase